jgi:hypothetical protein
MAVLFVKELLATYLEAIRKVEVCTLKMVLSIVYKAAYCSVQAPFPNSLLERPETMKTRRCGEALKSREFRQRCCERIR